MKLSKQNVDLFYKLMWRLQFYVNQKHHILSHVKSPEEYAEQTPSDKFKVRSALWKHPDLIDKYVKENPESHPKI